MIKSRMLRGSLIGTCVLLCTLAFQSCPTTRSRSFRKHLLEQYRLSDDDIDYIYKPLYANNFYISKEDGEKVLYLKDPASGKETRYVVNKVHRVVCLSSTHIAFLDALDETRSIVGISGAQYICNKDVSDAVDVGYESAIDYETLLQLRPDVVFAYAIHGQSSDYIDKIKQLGMNVIEIPEHMENHPLGKAEYLVAFAAFFDKEFRAIEQFYWISRKYEEYRIKARQAAIQQYRRKMIDSGYTDIDTLNGTFEPVKVLINAPFKDIWYIPGIESHQHILVADAGGILLGSKPGVNTSVISTEQAYLYALQADFWIHPNQFSDLESLANPDPRFAEVPAFRDRHVWNNNLRSTPEGGSDYFESGAVNPHLILADLIAIFYPTAIPNHKFTYYRQL
ncbi:MAG: ABC transporter substrate-binding protein [Bacteroidales bacterium]|nr:ABC transporter substrate-binding protein [Bacteroidales bacterium]MDD2264464.1 ABC transporter substrate-binding protein [Bacteroidales bacterium]MDD2831699.1 ABC transporter substrate-binding protein [Bacteroidales bacterium]MDD3208926.1 ABC transporter substrate-binding protein [Bacteroidales bacterium]MDD3697702.1 ABC transporter substrate-binding protein [Bacteroidales bacterium]